MGQNIANLHEKIVDFSITKSVANLKISWSFLLEKILRSIRTLDCDKYRLKLKGRFFFFLLSYLPLFFYSYIMSYDKKCHKVHVLWTFCVNGLMGLSPWLQIDWQVRGRKSLFRNWSINCPNERFLSWGANVVHSQWQNSWLVVGSAAHHCLVYSSWQTEFVLPWWSLLTPPPLLLVTATWTNSEAGIRGSPVLDSRLICL